MGKGKKKQNFQQNQNIQGDGEQKGVENEVNTTSEENQEKKNKQNSHEEIVLKAYIHCQGCVTKVHSSLKSLEGVEEVKVDSLHHKVVVKGQKADPVKVLERLQKKYSKNVELLYPKPKAQVKDKKEPEKKEQTPQVKVVVLKMFMHCEGCANDIKKGIERMKGVICVEPDIKKSQVTVRGAFEPPKLVESITKRLGKHAEILKQGAENKGQGAGNNNKNKDGENMFHYPPQYSIQHIYPSQIFSDENVFSCSIM